MYYFLFGLLLVGISITMFNEVNELKRQIQEISHKYQLELKEQASSLNKQQQKELEEKIQEINQLKHLNSEITTDFQAKIAEISQKHQLELKEQASSLNKQQQKELEEKTQVELNSLTNLSKSINNKVLPDKYLDLKKYLINKEWQNADKETFEVILEIINQKKSYITITDYQSIPLQDLIIIDSLWAYYSQNIFGLLSQYQAYLSIYQSEGTEQEKWQKIGDVLGWRKLQEWILSNNQLINSLDAMKGQFPFLIYWQGVWLGAFMEGQGNRFLALMNRFSDALK